MIPGLKDRLTNELKCVLPENNEVNIITPEKRNIAAWFGAAALSSNPDFTRWITRSEFQEHGNEVFKRKRC